VRRTAEVRIFLRGSNELATKPLAFVRSEDRHAEMLMDAPLIGSSIYTVGSPVLALQPGVGAPRKGIAPGGHSSKH
jgi:hypothetical protein